MFKALLWKSLEQQIVYHYLGEFNLNNQVIPSTILTHSDSISQNFFDELLFLQAYLIYSITTTITTTQVLLSCLSTPVPLTSKLLNIMIRHPTIQHNHPSTLTTLSLTEQHCNSLNTLPSFTLYCTLRSSLTNIMKSDSTVSTEHLLDLTDRSFDIGIDVDMNIDLNTIASIYVVGNIYTNDIVIPIVLASIISTVAVTNHGLKYLNQKCSTHKLQESESRVMII